jgi:O-antigen/teichoic acid export membrane protein
MIADTLKASVSRLPAMLATVRRSDSVRAVGGMAFFSALGQLAIFATLPVLTRLYDPAAFGVHALIMAFVGTASVAVCLCLEHRIVSTLDDSEADNMFAAALMGVPVTTALAAAVLAAMIGFGVFGYSKLPWWTVPLAALAILLNGVFSACRSRVVRQQDYRLIARTSLVQNVARALAPLPLFVLAPPWLGLTLGEMTGRMAGVRKLVRRVWARRKSGAVWLRPRAWVALVRKEYRFSALLTGTVLVDACASQLISPLLAATYGAQAAGVYFLVAMIIVGPSVLIGAGAADYIHGRGAELLRLRPGELPAFALRSATALLALGLAIFAPLFVLAPLVLPMIFGTRWPYLSETLQALTPYAIVGFVASPCSRLLAAVNMPTIKVICDVVRLIGVPVTINASHSAGAHFTQAMWNLSLFLTGAYGLYLLLTYGAVVLSAREARRDEV